MYFFFLSIIKCLWKNIFACAWLLFSILIGTWILLWLTFNDVPLEVLKTSSSCICHAIALI